MYSWLCSKCDRVSFSSSAMTEKEFIVCGYEDCQAKNINPYYTGGEGDETISTDSAAVSVKE